MADRPADSWEGPVGISLSGHQGHMRLIGARGVNLGRFVDARNATIASLEAHGNTNTTAPGMGSSLYVGELSVNANPPTGTPTRQLAGGRARGHATAFFGDHSWRQRDALRVGGVAICQAFLVVQSPAQRATWPNQLLFRYHASGVTVSGLPPFPERLTGGPS